jgi:SAM-dependent methyltransferase
MDFDAVYKEITAVSGSCYHARIKGRVAYTWEMVSPLITADSTVVEIGVGPMAAVVTQLKGAHVIGVDINDDQRDLCNRFKIDLRIRDIQAQALPLEDESADLILLLEVIEHLCIYPNYVLDEIYKKLKTNGYLVISTVNFLRISSRIRVLLGKNPLINYFEPSEDGRNHVREFVPAEMAYYMRESGFSIEKTCRFGMQSGPCVISMLLRLAYLYPKFRNHFMVVGKKVVP